jgi:hypothetical protein
MPTDDDDPKLQDLRIQRLNQLLAKLAEQGVSQKEVAFRAKVPPAYLADVKAGSRTLTELFARRLQEEFAVDYLWLLGQSNTMQMKRAVGTADLGSRHILLPVLAHLIDGDPRAHRLWEGSVLEVVGATATKADVAHLPYVFRCGSDDRQGRLRRADLILITQKIDVNAEIQLIKQAGKILLARRTSAHKWKPLLLNQRIPTEPIVVGHAVGILWGGL